MNAKNIDIKIKEILVNVGDKEVKISPQSFEISDISISIDRMNKLIEIHNIFFKEYMF